VANRQLYCEEAAVRTHLGNLKLPVAVTVESLCETAANEVDGLLGVRYAVPITVSVNVAEEKATSYWLQMVSSQIAAGRMMVSAGAAASQDTTNNYGRYLLSQAYGQIKLVTDGKKDLAGAVEIGNEDETEVKGPYIINQDAYSQVDAFYDNFEPDGFIPGRVPREAGTTWPR
jgi:hypothetical protein